MEAVGAAADAFPPLQSAIGIISGILRTYDVSSSFSMN